MKEITWNLTKGLGIALFVYISVPYFSWEQVYMMKNRKPKSEF